jgi:phosphotransferase family enzyme
VTNEEPLAGGNLSDVVRVGDTVRRPVGPWTPSVHALLRHLEAAGFDGAPRVLGIDEQGREILEYIPGEVPWLGDHKRLLGDEASVVRAAGLLRAFHDAVADFRPPSGATWRFPDMEEDSDAWVDGRGKIVCHNDATAWNLVIGDGRWAFVDWDVAGPRPFIWDVAYLAIGLTPITADASGLGWPDTVPFADRLNALADGYRLLPGDRARFAGAITARIRSSYEHGRRRAEAGQEPWARLWREGHGEGWLSMLRLAEANEGRWTDTLTRPR